jgi:hypothetical protein
MITANSPALIKTCIHGKKKIRKEKYRAGPVFRRIFMDYVSMLGDSFAYAKDAVVGKWKQWLLLFAATLLLCIPLFGYILNVLRGKKPAPEVTGWGTLFIDGIRYLIVTTIYALPALIIFFVTLGSVVVEILAGNPAGVAAVLGGLMFGLVLFLVIAFICSLFGTIGVIRFARTGSMGEAFNFSAISAAIGRIGWINYIIALAIMAIIQVLISLLLSYLAGIPYAGILIELIIVAPVAIFEARYLSLVYDEAVTA